MCISATQLISIASLFYTMPSRRSGCGDRERELRGSGAALVDAPAFASAAFRTAAFKVLSCPLTDAHEW